MLATFRPSVASMEEEFRDMAAANGIEATIETVLIEGALKALKGGDAETCFSRSAARLAHGDSPVVRKRLFYRRTHSNRPAIARGG